MNLNCKAIIATLILGMTFLSHSSSFAGATETNKLRRASVKEDGVSKRWIVVLNDEQDLTDTSKYQKNLKGEFVQTKEQLEGFASAYGGTVTHFYKEALYGMAVTMEEDDAERMVQDPRVKYIEQDTIVRLSQQSPATWGIDRIDQRDLPLDNTYNPGAADGTGVTAYIIDSGVQVSHNEFKNASGQSRAVLGVNTSGDGQDQDCNGHGTHVAGIVGGLKFGVAKNVNIIAVKVLQCSGSGSIAGVIDGVEWAMNHAATNGISNKAVANMSLGGGFSSATNTAVRNLHNSGVLTAVAAGNSNADACNFSPASEPTVITVGSTTSTDALSLFSNHGSCLDIFAPGSSITAAYIGDNSTIRTISGTSQASPHVAGALALSISGNSLDAVNDIINAATPDKVIDPNGSPNLLLYVSNINSDPAPSNSPSISPAPSVSASLVPTRSPLTTKSPTTKSPTTSPPTTCVDPPLKFKFVKSDRSGFITTFEKCSWVGLNKRERCGVRANSISCPKTCNRCNFCRDSTLKFNVDKNNKTLKRGCKWVEKKSLCNNPAFANACRSTCDVC